LGQFTLLHIKQTHEPAGGDFDIFGAEAWTEWSNPPPRPCDIIPKPCDIIPTP
jgi:hypothetical protein